MFFVPSGENTVRAVRYLFCSLALLAVISMWGCGKSDRTSSGTHPSDQQLIQESLTEAITRWHYGDKAALYDNEFEYVQNRFSFDEYLKFGQLKLDADTVEGIAVKKVQLFGRDSALVNVDVEFKGPTGNISHQLDTYPMYFHRGKWIRPTLGRYSSQMAYEQSRHEADSAADAEAKELDAKVKAAKERVVEALGERGEVETLGGWKVKQTTFEKKEYTVKARTETRLTVTERES